MNKLRKSNSNDVDDDDDDNDRLILISKTSRLCRILIYSMSRFP